MDYEFWSQDEVEEFKDKLGISIWRVSSGRYIHPNDVARELDRELTLEETKFVRNMHNRPRFTNLNENLVRVNKARQTFHITIFPGGVVRLVEKSGYVNYPFGIVKGTYDITHLPTGYVIGYGSKFDSFKEVKAFVDMVVNEIPDLSEMHVVGSAVQDEYMKLYRSWD